MKRIIEILNDCGTDEQRNNRWQKELNDQSAEDGHVMPEFKLLYLGFFDRAFRFFHPDQIEVRHEVVQPLNKQPDWVGQRNAQLNVSPAYNGQRRSDHSAYKRVRGRIGPHRKSSEEHHFDHAAAYKACLQVAHNKADNRARANRPGYVDGAAPPVRFHGHKGDEKTQQDNFNRVHSYPPFLF